MNPDDPFNDPLNFYDDSYEFIRTLTPEQIKEMPLATYQRLRQSLLYRTTGTLMTRPTILPKNGPLALWPELAL